MNKEAVFHLNTEEYVYPINRQQLVFRLRTAKNDAKSVTLIHWDRSRPSEQRSETLNPIICDDLFEYYETVVGFTDVAKYRKYYFEIIDKNDSKWFLNADGLSECKPETGFFEYLYANGTDVINVPEWSKGAIYYQIFPERFENGDANLNPTGTMPWGTEPTRENYMGGDLRGIINRLDYLSELGIECIYLNPIFEADFNHKYATTDYYRVDPQFGTNEMFKELVDKCHKKHIRVILDGVFNHTGVNFKPFDNLYHMQAKSNYADWYHIEKFPFDYSEKDYECVGDYKWMPKLNTANPEVRDFIIDVMNYWIENFGIDGWRLDVSDEVDPSVWEMARLILKEKYPDIVLIGETWGYGGKLLRGNQMDSVMNYMFMDAVWDYFGKEVIDAKVFADRIGHMLSLYKTSHYNSLFNLIDSHDTERFLYISNENINRLKMAATFQFMFIGSPSIYYGDEIGMSGGNDPDDRRCMQWDKVNNNEMLEYYRELVNLRKSHPAIRYGDFRFEEVDAEKDLITFSRSNGEETIHVTLQKRTDLIKIIY